MYVYVILDIYVHVIYVYVYTYIAISRENIDLSRKLAHLRTSAAKSLWIRSVPGAQAEAGLRPGPIFGVELVRVEEHVGEEEDIGE